MNCELFVTFLQRLMRGRRKPLHLVLDNLPAHKKDRALIDRPL